MLLLLEVVSAVNLMYTRIMNFYSAHFSKHMLSPMSKTVYSVNKINVLILIAIQSSTWDAYYTDICIAPHKLQRIWQNHQKMKIEAAKSTTTLLDDLSHFWMLLSLSLTDAQLSSSARCERKATTVDDSGK